MDSRNGILIKHLMVLLTIIITLSILSCDSTQRTIVYRDIWGIPHIFADSEADMAFAFGYVQAEDRLEQILRSYRYAEGTLSEAFGDKYIKTDYVQRVWQHAKISREKFSDLSSDLQKIATYFIAGIKQFMKDHPDKVPDWAPEIHPWHVLAWGRTFIWGWPLGQALGDLRRGKRKIEVPHHSNQWVVSSEKTVLGVPIALIDPHLNFETSGHWYEARLHAEEIEACGMSVPGTPFIGLGHNRYISWAATTGGPDCSDVYELEINPDNQLQYKYDGEWREIETEKIIIRVKENNGFAEVEKSIERCHYGPIHERDGNKAFALKISYENEVSLAEQMLKINKAKNLDQFEAALSMCQLMPQNMMCASVNGNIY
jgi:acyl-homoserine lactone acylase PvdQ